MHRTIINKNLQVSQHGLPLLLSLIQILSDMGCHNFLVWYRYSVTWTATTLSLVQILSDMDCHYFLVWYTYLVTWTATTSQFYTDTYFVTWTATTSQFDTDTYFVTWTATTSQFDTDSLFTWTATTSQFGITNGRLELVIHPVFGFIGAIGN